MSQELVRPCGAVVYGVENDKGTDRSCARMLCINISIPQQWSKYVRVREVVHQVETNICKSKQYKLTIFISITKQPKKSTKKNEAGDKNHEGDVWDHGSMRACERVDTNLVPSALSSWWRSTASGEHSTSHISGSTYHALPYDECRNVCYFATSQRNEYHMIHSDQIRYCSLRQWLCVSTAGILSRVQQEV